MQPRGARLAPGSFGFCNRLARRQGFEIQNNLKNCASDSVLADSFFIRLARQFENRRTGNDDYRQKIGA